MHNLLFDNLGAIAGEAIRILSLIVTGVVLLDRAKNAARDLKKRVDSLDQWRDEHISSVQPHTVCILEDWRKGDEREWLERIERKIDRLEERIDKLTEKIHG
jgi:prefoldin subunit 5